MPEQGMSEIIAVTQRGNLTKLETTALPAIKIGKKSYRSVVSIVESKHITYQQKTHVFGNIAPTIGGTWDGYGTVFGGGGSIASTSESVVQVVYCDFDDCEQTAELPASISAREGSVLRLNFMNNNIFAAQNISGRQNPRGLLGPADFIPWPQWSGFLTFCICCVIVALLFHSVLGALFFGLPPALNGYDRYKAKRHRQELGEYMGRALSMMTA